MPMYGTRSPRRDRGSIRTTGTEDLRTLGADQPSITFLMSVPCLAWVLAYTITSEIGDIRHFASPKKLAGYTGLCPMVSQSGGKDRRGPLAKNGPKYPALGAHRGRAVHVVKSN